jgi:hypothetical protein
VCVTICNSLSLCVCVCARARVCVCVCLCVCTHAYIHHVYVYLFILLQVYANAIHPGGVNTNIVSKGDAPNWVKSGNL